MTVQLLLVMVGAAGLMFSTIALVRHQLLSLRYGIGWLMVSVVGFAGAPLLSVLSSKANSLGFTATGLSAGVFILFLMLICLQLSISLSGLHRAIQDLTEHGALVENRVRALETKHSERPRESEPQQQFGSTK